MISSAFSRLRVEAAGLGQDSRGQLNLSRLFFSHTDLTDQQQGEPSLWNRSHIQTLCCPTPGNDRQEVGRFNECITATRPHILFPSENMAQLLVSVTISKQGFSLLESEALNHTDGGHSSREGRDFNLRSISHRLTQAGVRRQYKIRPMCGKQKC